MRAKEFFENIRFVPTKGKSVDKSGYRLKPDDVKQLLLKILNKKENELSRGEKSYVEKLFIKPRLNYTDIHTIIRGGWGNNVWSKFIQHINDRFIE